MNTPKPTSDFRRHVRQFLRRPTAVFGLVLVLSLLVAGLLAPWIAPYDPDARFSSIGTNAPSISGRSLDAVPRLDWY